MIEMNQIFGEDENERKILDLSDDDIRRIGIILTEMGAKIVSDKFPRRIRTLDNGISKEKDQLLRITEEEGHTKLTLHINQSDAENKRPIKIHLKEPKRIMDFLAARYGETLTSDVVAPRTSLELGEGEKCVDFDIDEYPAIPAFLEVDLANLNELGLTLEQLLSKLGLQNHRVVNLGTEDIHALYGVDYFEVYAPKKEEEIYRKTL